EPASYVFRLKGLRAGGRYRLHFRDGSSPDGTVSGAELMDTGLVVSLPLPNSSELVQIERIR
ncbi:MAG TPA: GH36 C-terminal domain-containing protein, partial [Rhodanobacteraceae bacterium]|nr:GH36 C-terminal domain-containing protein [Rhodanobacteraceae bacterium]